MTLRKICKCSGTATTGRIILTETRDATTDSFRIKATLHIGPVCDICDTPWEEVDTNTTGGEA